MALTNAKTARLLFLSSVFGTTLLLAPQVASGKEGPAPLPGPEIEKPLIAYWTFDELLGGHCADQSGNGCDAAPAKWDAPGLERIEGPFDGAMSFLGSHSLQVPGKPDFSELPKLSISVWLMPSDLSGNREIFRKEDGPNRVRLAFQDHGAAIVFGLNVNGYVECRAPIDPKRILDGNWRHCAATFDGRAMRVYLDGKEIGALERPGRIVAGGDAPACIGSANGEAGFLGAMDELRIYRDALAPAEIAQIYDHGARALARFAESPGAGEPTIEKPLLAHWTFNEPSREPDIVVSGKQPIFRVKPGRGAPRVRGVHGNALRLRGTHALRVEAAEEPAELSAIAFSAWVRPTDLSGFREIFRRECDERLLFSFQNNGTILSLGLNVDGYVECDAPIDPAKALDGGWRHCATDVPGWRISKR